MIISAWLIYFADLCDSVGALFLIFSFISLVSIIFGMIVIGSANDLTGTQEEEKVRKAIGRKLIKISFISLIICLLITSIIPSTKTVYKMMIIPTVVNSSVAQKLPDELQQFIDKELKTNVK